MIRSSMFVIAVPNLAKSAEFYENVLGFVVSELGDSGWRIYQKDSCKIMAGECPDALPPKETGDHSYFCYLVTDNAQEYYDQVRSFDVEIIKELQDEPWEMREFGFRTIDGHRIMVGQSL